jgi:ubiquinone/menaquinone biosynthesis C-methylase UbiE
MSILPGHNILEPGCGTGRLTPLLAEMVGPKGKVFAFDISPRMVEKCVARNLPPHVEVAQASAMSLRLPDREFDAIVCVNAFPHFKDASAVLCEFHRILRKEGVLWVAHTHSREWVNSLHSSIGGILSTHLLPTNAEFEGLLRESGFSLALLHDLPDRFLLKAVPVL